MLKKVLLMIAVMIFAFSCSSPSDPNNGGTGDTGDGSIIDEGSGTTDQTSISDFLKKYSGRYHSEVASEYGGMTRYIYYRIEDGKIYEKESQIEMQYKKTLLGNKIQVEIPGDETSIYGSDRNSNIEIFNFYNDKIQIFYKYVFQKENFNIPKGYEIVGTFSQAAQYAGNYYEYEGEEGYNEGIKKYNLFIIDESGNIYIEKTPDAQTITCTLKGNVLTLSFGEGSYECILEATRAIISIQQNNQEQSFIYKKSDLLTPYKGTYTGNGVTLTVNEANAEFTPNNLTNPSAILNGNNLVIYEHIIYNDTLTVKEHKIVFSEDKKTATYTYPDTQQKVTLTRQGV
ncbi:hypothetical protein [Brachyspira pulli]|uniref:hypothetical protein n=1 Tax=Brachyspira pulli TaxID=310721 RepID=UPI003006CD2D